jgi:PEP-CTERM/exosortase A-associated glycosyltransferase
MRVLHILDHSVPLHSGYTFRTLAILREQRRLGWDTFHLTSPKHPQYAGAEDEAEGLRFYRTPPVAAKGLLAGVREPIKVMSALARRLDEVVETVRPDLLHAHSPVLNALPALWVGSKRKIPVVYEVRAFWEDAAVDHGTSSEGGLRYRMTRGLETWALRHVDAVTTICDGLRREIVERGIAPDRVTVIPNAVDVDKFTVEADAGRDLRIRLGLAGATVLGFIGSFYAYEGLAMLLEAFPAIRSRHPEAKILLVGGGPQDEALRTLAGKLSIADAVVFTGRVPHAEVERYYDVVDLLVYPRLPMRLTELVTPLKPLEAMAGGRLLIASDVGGHRELIRHGETGILFKAGSVEDLARETVQLLDARASWPELRARARRFVENERTWAQSVANYRAVYNSLRPAQHVAG